MFDIEVYIYRINDDNNEKMLMSGEGINIHHACQTLINPHDASLEALWKKIDNIKNHIQVNMKPTLEETVSPKLRILIRLGTEISIIGQYLSNNDKQLLKTASMQTSIPVNVHFLKTDGSIQMGFNFS